MHRLVQDQENTVWEISRLYMKECKGYVQTANESSPRVLCAISLSQLGGLDANAKRKKILDVAFMYVNENYYSAQN